jgi:predicted  nucleic acid-binding Zn-ribbon protein
MYRAHLSSQVAQREDEKRRTARSAERMAAEAETARAKVVLLERRMREQAGQHDELARHLVDTRERLQAAEARCQEFDRDKMASQLNALASSWKASLLALYSNFVHIW